MLTPEVTVQKDHFGGEHRIGKIGIVSDKMEYKKWPPLKAVKQASLETWNLTVSTLQAIGQMIVGVRGTDEIGGPVSIAKMAGHVAQDGAWALVWLMAIISINLGLINLFPVPLLDGGHLVFYAYEKAFGKPMNEKVQEFGMRVGLVLIVSLMVFATSNDLHLPALFDAWFL
jgi:regulator of sigma E protease